jgi:hypothetical protein
MRPKWLSLQLTLVFVPDIQIWAPQQAQAFSLRTARNALLTLIVPLAFQNSMLFEATIAMSRAAWVLRRGSEPLGDKMLLRHRGAAMKELRDSLMLRDEQPRPSQDLVLLTMSTLLTLNVRSSGDRAVFTEVARLTMGHST